jgi:hypothetical protein
VATERLTSRAIAYLKAELPADEPSPSITLSGPDAPVLRRLTSGLLVAYLVDAGDQFEYVQERDLAQDGINADELHAIGLANLASRDAGGVRVAPHPGGQMFAVLMGGNFEASLILVDWLWDEGFRRFVGGDYVVAVPARDLLAFCDVTSADGLRDLGAVCQRAQSPGVSHRISDRLYRRRDRGWQVFGR